MSVIDNNRPVPLGATAAYGFVSFVERALEGYRAWRAARATAVTLSELSDKQLSDIGIVRGEIEDVAAALARR